MKCQRGNSLTSTDTKIIWTAPLSKRVRSGIDSDHRLNGVKVERDRTNGSREEEEEDTRQTLVPSKEKESPTLPPPTSRMTSETAHASRRVREPRRFTAPALSSKNVSCFYSFEFNSATQHRVYFSKRVGITRRRQRERQVASFFVSFSFWRLTRVGFLTRTKIISLLPPLVVVWRLGGMADCWVCACKRPRTQPGISTNRRREKDTHISTLLQETEKRG